MHPQKNWETTGRLEIENPYRVDGEEVVLGPTHEEIVTPLASKFVNSYKDLPFHVYQIQNKFRKELRAKSGLLRGREFIMKDLYSFHADEEDLEKYYEKVKAAYVKIFERAGIGNETYCTFASGGSFSKYSHEFQTTTEAGEDTIHICTKCSLAINEEIKGETPECPDCGNKEFNTKKAIEVGNIFKLKTKYSEPFKLTFKDKEGKDQPVIMGCYGIGLQRLIGTVVEVHHDDKGIIWPASVAPYQVHLIGLGLDKPEVSKRVEEIYASLQAEGFEVIFDDRLEATAGTKFADSDLLGIPVRLVISAKTGEKIEYKERTSEDTELLDLAEVLAKLKTKK